MSSHADDARKALRSITGKRTNVVKATVALVHATLEVAAASDRQTAAVKRLWNEDK